MLFPTTVFAVFFLCVFSGSWLLAERKTLWKCYLLICSYVFYGWWDWRFLSLIVLCSLVNHAAAIGLSRVMRTRSRRSILTAAILCNLGVLGFFKYYKFFVLSAYATLHQVGLSCSLPLLDVVLPVGISFFTFQAMSYVIDVYRKDTEPAQSLLEFSTYLAFFPQLVAGPIVRARVLLPQLAGGLDRRHIDAGRASSLILAGLFKKTVVANTLSQCLVDPVFEDPSAFAGPDVLLGVYGYAVQIYCDFSAYSDIAIGVALLLGIRFPANFNAPYFACSFRTFWQRWHISLSTWLRDYLYIPLGGSRGASFRVSRNLMLTFLLGGLWHGAQWRFVAWGALHGFYLLGERMLTRVGVGAPSPRVGGRRPGWVGRGIAWVIVFHLICLSWVFFRAENFADAWLLLGRFGDWKSATLWTIPTVGMLLVGFAAQALDGTRMAPVWNWLNRQSFLLHGGIVAIILTIILGLGPQGVAPFIYFQF
ncbi:MAG: MBOAT family protein [Verrucomicrobia bacterium]|jgi:alginate O-acetyltransferase complex protein AlgI|nr:MBOAT family protein [Verrucomicrobiota bacterium]